MGEQKQRRLEAFVSFPSLYTQTLVVQSLVKLVRDLSISLVPPNAGQPPALQWADYDLIDFEYPHSNPSTHLTSSYVYRKALIRKHQLHATTTEYLAKSRHRGKTSVLEEAMPTGWSIEIRFADELEEALLDELGDLRVELEENENREEQDKIWYILKPGFADRAQGIRLFSTIDELQEIFESFEEESEEEDDDAEVERKAELIDQVTAESIPTDLQALRLHDQQRTDENETAILTSHLRHFIIQEYISKPILFNISQLPTDRPAALEGHKFHLRAYVLVTGGYTVHLSRTILALFSAIPYHAPSAIPGHTMDLTAHLTNTCLQTDAYGAPAPPEELVKLFWELEGLNALQNNRGEYTSHGRVTKSWLDETFSKVGDIIAESVKAGAECGSFGLQLIPNAFEIFGVDLLLSFPEKPILSEGLLAPPIVTLLEYNASPDFHQSGQRMKGELAEMFQGMVRISIAPFFSIKIEDEEFEEKYAAEWTLGEERWGWTLIGSGEVRGSW